jgi:Na+/melibiose symporter-like transporter
VTDAAMATPKPAADPDRVSIGAKIAFGLGGSAETIALFSVTTWALLFYNQVHGMDAGLAGLAIAISLLLDGLIDPLVGSISDRTKHRLGRRHPYMFAAPPAIALSFIAIFNPPAGLPELGLFAWFTAAVICLRCSMAFFHVPHLALGGELSPNYIERSHIMAYNNFFVWVGGSSIFMIGMTFFFHATPDYPRGLLNPAAYAPFSLVAAGMALVILFASAWFTRDRIPMLPRPPENLPKFSPFEFMKDIGKAFSNINYVWLLVAYLFLSMMVGVRGGLSLYIGTYLFELSSEQLRFYVIGSFVGYVVALIASARLHGRFDKRRVMIWSAMIYAIAPALPATLRLAGVFFENGDPMLLPALVAISAFSYGSAAVLTISVMSALADIADQNDLKFGIRQEGVLYATRALFAKVDQAIGSFLAGLALTLIAFPKKAEPGAVPIDILHNLAWVEGPIAAVPGILAVIFYARYRIDLKSHEATRAALAARRG